MAVNYEHFLTVGHFRQLLGQMKGYFIAPFARRLLPGARINGVPFDGSHDITIPASPQDGVCLLPNVPVYCLYDEESSAGIVIRGDGIYYSDGSELKSLIKITKQSDGSFTVNKTTGAYTESLIEPTTEVEEE